MKKEIILNAQSVGYFRVKSAEKRAEAFKELLSMEQHGEMTENEVSAVLEAETLRRQVVSQNRAKRAIDKAQADAEKPLVAGDDSAVAHVKEMAPGRYVLTTAQNNTEVDPVFMACLLRYVQAMGATLLIARTTYNLNGFQQSQDATEGVYYVDDVKPFLVEGQISLGGVDFVAQANVLPTAKNPLSGFESITPAGVNVVIPATKIALKCTAALKHAKGKILFSTGTVTKRNYIMRKAGAVAASEHNIGALFVDTSNGGFVARQLELMPNSGGFYDEGVFYTPDHQLEGIQATALQFGDIHAEKMKTRNLHTMLAQIRRYNPENIVVHDVMDFSSRNHHNVKDCAFMFAQTVQAQTVARDIQKVATIIDAIAREAAMARVHIIESNHDLAINTWLKNADFKTDPVNALTYLKCMTALYSHIDKHGNTNFNMLQFAYREIGNGVFADSIDFHGTDESVILAGVEMGCHGHTGINGSRGSPAQFRTLGIPMNTGHTHTPSITGACYTAGVSASLEMGYNVGPSSWQLANVLTWPNGQRQVIFM